MGLFQFIKDAGAKLFGSGSANADELKKTVEGHGLDAKNLSIEVNGDKVKVSGQGTTQEEVEKIILALGNTIGVAEVDTSGVKVSTPSAEAVMYTVKKGDSLWKIAEAHFGKGQGARYPEIVKANTPPVKNPDLIQPGWVLRLPPK